MTSPSKKRMRSCHEGKKRYNDIKEAEAALFGWLNKRKKLGNPIVSFMQVYGCACGGFHIGRSRGINWAAVTKASEITKLSELHK
jgi:hypothetical protein